MDDDPFDAAFSGLVVLAALVVLGACVFGADWVRPPEEGTGPFVTPERAHAFRVVAVVAVAVCVGCVARALWGGPLLLLGTAGLALAVVAGFAFLLYFPHPRVELSADGFSTSDAHAAVRESAVFYNSTGTDLVVCLGAGGTCDARAPGPPELRSPGLVVPAGRRVGVDMPNRPGEFRVTLVGARPGAGRRDMVLHAERVQGP